MVDAKSDRQHTTAINGGNDSTRWDRSVRCKRTTQSAAAIVCLMSPPANEKRAFTYVRLQRTDRSQRVAHSDCVDC